MVHVFKATCCSLRVRVTNRSAITLYRDVLGYKIHDVEKQYYADKEDAFDMRIDLRSKEQQEADEKDAQREDAVFQGLY